MRQILAAAILTLAVISSGTAIAAEQSVTLRIENMFCASCPYIVQQTLVGIPGVTHVEISYHRATAIVLAVVDYEDTEANVTALTAATSEIGFPATVIQ